MQKARGENCAGRADRVAMRNSPALNIHNIFRQTKVLGYGNRNCSECLINFDALDVGSFPTSPFECLLDGRNRTKSEHSWLDSPHTIGDKSGHGLQALFLGP